MEMLDSVLAFSLVMILLSTIVSGIAEIALRVTRLRAHYLFVAVQALVRDAIAQEAGPGTVERLALALVHNPAAAWSTAVRESGTASPDLVKPGLFGRWLGLFNQARTDVLSAEAFVQRLAKTGTGRDLARTRPEETLDLRLKDLVNTFDRYMAASAEVYRKRAQWVAMLAAVLLAIVANVNAASLFDHLSKDEDLRRALLADSQRITEKLAEAGARSGYGVTATLRDELSKVNDRLADIETTYGLPIGPAYFPWNLTADGNPKATRPAFDLAAEVGEAFAYVTDHPGRMATWLIQVVLTGVLIGLGGPFWFRIYSNLSQFVQVLRSFGGRSKELVGATGADARPRQPEDREARLNILIDLFKTAATGPAPAPPRTAP